MQTVILAAGEGTRMRPLTDSTPKPMLPVGDRPLVARAADVAVDAGATELIVVVGYEADLVRDFFGVEYRGVPVTFAHQTDQRGTADAVRAASEYLDGDFVVLNGDNLYDPPAISSLFSESPAIATVPVDDPSNYGVLTTDGHQITGIVEKPEEPPSNLANGGAYAFPERAREWLGVDKSRRGEYEITDVVARVIDEFDVTSVELDQWLDVGRPWELLEANEVVLDELDRNLAGNVADEAVIRGPVTVEAGASIEPGVVIEGPVLVRSGATVGPNAYVRGKSVLGKGTKVGQSVEIKNSLLMDGSAVPHLSYVGDSVLGRNVNLGAGTNVGNLRHDGRDVEVTVKGERVSTGRRKFGIVAGDGVKTGINTSLNPGVTLSSGSWTEPGESVTRDR